MYNWRLPDFNAVLNVSNSFNTKDFQLVIPVVAACMFSHDSDAYYNLPYTCGIGHP